MEWVVRPIGVLPPSRSGLARVIPEGTELDLEAIRGAPQPTGRNPRLEHLGWINRSASFFMSCVWIAASNPCREVTATKNDGGSAGEGGKAGTHSQPEQALLGVGHGALAGGFGVEHYLEIE